MLYFTVMSYDLYVVYQKLEDSTSLSALIANTKEWVGSELWSVHPYQFELENFEPIPEQLQLQEPQVIGHL